MNLAVHGLEGRINKAITYYDDPHELVGKADFVMANPPFNVDEIDADKIRRDPRLEHEANGGKAEESSSVVIEILEILGEATAAIQPCNRPFDDPPFGQNDKTPGLIGSPGNFRFEVRQDFRQHLVEDWARIGAISKRLFQEWETAKQSCQQHDAAISVLELRPQRGFLTECIEAPNQRKWLYRNDFSMIRGAPRCRQTVPRISSNLNPSKDAKWSPRSTPVQ